jgi:hypothetical protein
MMLSSKRRRLRLAVRDDDVDDGDSSKSTSNLFARLSPGVARDLRSLAMMSVPKYDPSSDVPNQYLTWRLGPSIGNDDEDPTFLPLSIVFNEGSDGNESNNMCTIYASYNGGNLSGRLKNSINDGMCIQTI